MPTEEYTNKNIEEYKNFLKNDKYKKEKLISKTDTNFSSSPLT